MASRCRRIGHDGRVPQVRGCANGRINSSSTLREVKTVTGVGALNTSHRPGLG